jgi:hypothetical protein
LRSPAYPVVNLETAVKRAMEFYNLEHRNSANPAVALKHWGYDDPKNSYAARVLAALKQFGLMKEAGTKVQLSELALRIILDKRPESTDRDAALKEAALSPKIHASLRAAWTDSPPTDHNLRHDLIFKWKFNENRVDKFIQEYKETLAFAKLDSSDSLPIAGDDKANIDGELTDRFTTINPPAESEKGVKTNPSIGSTTKLFPPSVGMNQDIYTLSGGNAALILQWPTSMTTDDIEDVELWLDMMKRKLKRAVQKKEGEEAE